MSSSILVSEQELSHGEVEVLRYVPVSRNMMEYHLRHAAVRYPINGFL